MFVVVRVMSRTTEDMLASALERTRRTVAEQAAEIALLTAKMEAWRRGLEGALAVDDHSAAIVARAIVESRNSSGDAGPGASQSQRAPGLPIDETP